MTYSKNYITGLVLAVSLLFAANAKADLITMYSAAERAAYMAAAGPSEWGLVGSADFDKEKAPYTGQFTLTNLANRWADENNQVENRTGGYTMNSWDGMGAGYTNTLHGTGVDTGLSFSHNSANQFGVSTPDGLINAFYLNVNTHANEASTKGTYNITFYGEGGERLQTFNNVAFGFAGFIFGEGSTLTRFEITTNGNKNTGYSVDFVTGDGKAVTPEPATLAIIGLGLAGLGLARARQRK